MTEAKFQCPICQRWGKEEEAIESRKGEVIHESCFEPGDHEH